MGLLKFKILFNPEPFLEKVFAFTERLIRLRLFDAPILHLEPSPDGQSQTATVVYMHSIRREREGYQCRFFVLAYTHKQGDTPPRGAVRAYIMEYPLIVPSRQIKGWEYTVPTLEHPWAN